VRLRGGRRNLFFSENENGDTKYVFRIVIKMYSVKISSAADDTIGM